MINKSFLVSALSIVSIVGTYSVFKSIKTEEKNSEYLYLAVTDNELFATGSFTIDQSFTQHNNILISSEKSALTQTARGSATIAEAPAITAVAISKFINGNLPSTTPNGNNGVPTLLSQTGAFSNLSSLTPAPGLIPYDMIEPFWSDGATKKRWMIIPNNGTHDTPEEQIQYSENNAWDFPKGAVLIKHFELGGKRLETRFEVKGDDNVYYYLTYKWNDAQTDASLLIDAVDEDVVVNGVTQTWHYPSRNECASCHFPQNGSVLGPKTRNLNKSIVYPSTGIEMNQLVNLSELGILNETITNGNVNTYPAVAAKNDNTATLEERARTYLDVNCASCHNPNVENIAMFDARFTTALENQNIVYGDIIYDEGLNDPKVIIPQDVANSMAHFRMNSTQTGIAMPPLAKDVVDTDGVQLIEAWINSITPSTTQPPVAVFSASTTYGPAPLNIIFDASSSYDADGDSLNYSWDFGDGNTAQGITINHTYTNTGSYTAILTVNDGERSDEATTTIVVNNSNPGLNRVSFTDATSLLNQNNYSGLPMGVIDMNGDGKDDIVQFNSAKTLRIQYQNGVNQNFTTYNFGQVSNNNQWSTAIADYDQNGFNDILSGGAYDNLKIISNNNGSNSYTSAILPNSNIFIQGSNFVDINNDGWSDIFACHDDAESRAYENYQNGTFSFNANLIRTATTPTSDNSGNYASMWVDYDNDGDLDLYISKCRGGVTSSADPRRINMLWQNDGNNNFNEVAGEANLKIGDQTWLTDFGDIDNDGDLDAIVINHGTGPNLMRNNGNGTFTEITAGSGLLPTLEPQDFYGIQGFFRDFNNDGYLDLMVSGDNHYIFYNNGDGTFQNAPNPFSSNKIQSFSVGDLNQDGFLDIYAGYATGLNSPSSTRDRIWLNEGNDNNFLNLQLKGTQSNINAIGARVELHGAWGVQIRDVRSGEGYGLVNSYTQHFGIGASTQVDKIVVKWPSGNVDEILNPAINQFLPIIESLPQPTCNDGIQNGDETGIDCGGSCNTVCPCEGTTVVSIDFENGSGNDWSISGTASTGAFVVANPSAQTTSGILTQLEDDHSVQGSNALFTATNTSVGVNDVDGGVSIATSPAYNIQEDSELSIWYFFGQRDAGTDPGDYFLLEYSINGGSTYTTLASYGDETVQANWTEAIAEIPQGSNLVVRVSASDGPANGDIVEAGIDDFTVTSICTDPIAITGVVISPNSITLTEGDNQQLTANVSPVDADDSTVSWSSSNTNIATVNVNGMVTAIAEGTATITATTTDGNFEDASTVTVERETIPVTGVSLSPTSASLTIGSNEQLTATISPANADNPSVSWSSSNPSIASINANGMITALAQGTTIITVTTIDGNFTATTTITVNPVANVEILIAPNPADYVAYVVFESTTALVINTINIYDSSSNLIKTFSDPTSVLDGENYRLIVNDLPIGNYILEGVTPTGNYQKELEIYRDIVPVTGISLNTTNASIQVGNTLSLNANVIPNNATNTNVNWSSSDSTIATVNSTGIITGVSTGEAIIFVTTEDGNYSADATITVTNEPISNVTMLIAPNPADYVVYVNFSSNTPIEITSLNIYDNSNTVVKTFNDPETILDGDNYRLIINDLPTGNYTIEGVSSSGNHQKELIIEREYIAVSGISINTDNDSVQMGSELELTATVTPNNATNNSINWSSSNTSIATVNSSGTVTGVAEGSVDITATSVDGEFTATTTISVTAEPVSNVIMLVAPNPADYVIYTYFSSPTPLQITSINIYNSNTTLVKEFDDPASLLIDGENYRLVVSDLPIGDYIIEGNSTTGNYQKPFSIVREVVPVTGMSLGISSASINVGEVISLPSTITPNDASDQSIIWSSNNTTVATVNANGTVTGVSEGEAVITATTNDGNYTASATITVTEVTMLIAPNPATFVFYVYFSSTEPLTILTINIYDSLGRLVKTFSDPNSVLVDGENYRLLVDELPSGNYFIEGVTTTGNYQKQAVIE